jgi:hypothetical protein
MCTRTVFLAVMATILSCTGLRFAHADEVYLWHRMQLYCSASENKAVLLAQGSWSPGELELPKGIARLASGLDRKEGGTCTLPDGRVVRVSQTRLPFDLGRCGADPVAMFSLYLNDAAVIHDRDFYDCHNGYDPLAIVLEGDSLRACTSMERKWSTVGVTKFEDYKCQEMNSP